VDEYVAAMIAATLKLDEMRVALALAYGWIGRVPDPNDEREVEDYAIARETARQVLGLTK
jgi:hypothetical protein